MRYRMCPKCGKAKPAKEFSSEDGYCHVCERLRCREKHHAERGTGDYASISKTVERIKAGEAKPYKSSEVIGELKYAIDGLKEAWLQIASEHPGVDLSEAVKYLNETIKEVENV